MPVSDINISIAHARPARPGRILSIWIAAGLTASLAPHTFAQVVAETLNPHTTVFHASPAAKAGAKPSIALIVPRTGAAAKADGALVPTFAASANKQVVTVRVPAGTSLYGVGEFAGPLLRNGQTITLWNHDAYGFDDKTPHLYQSHPWVLGVRPDGSSFGVIFDSTFKQVISLPGDAGGDIKTTADGPAFPVIIIDSPTPQDVMKGLASLVGTMPLPPQWSLGYHQCRYSYYPDARVMEIAKGFRDRKIPCDVIWHDIDYMHKFLCFTFDEKHFPDPKRHNDDLHKLGFHTVWMIDPGIGINKDAFPKGGYKVFEQGEAGDHWVKTKDGKPFTGDVWPGPCHFPDFMRKETRTWWASQYKGFLATGVDGIWNDMNEPAVFNVPSKTMPEDNVHRADPELGGTGSHLQYHNVYGMHMIKAAREGMAAAQPERRPFVLSRANYLGGHRYGATWTGDNSASWQHLEWSVSMVLNIGLSGQPNIGPDIGGFAGNGNNGEGVMSRGTLFARWMGVGALMPFARAHTAKDNIDKEPWSFGPEVEATCKAAIERRYRLMPYLYTLFREASVNGMPVARPLFFADPKDLALRSEDDAFLLGDGLMVVAQMVPDRSRVPALPKDGWRRFTFAGEKPDADLPDLYIKAGTAIPTGPIMQFVGEKPLDTLTLLIAPDSKGQATGTLYEDAGDGLGYQKGEYRLTTFNVTTSGGTAKVTTTTEGSWQGPKWKVEPIIVK
ncbi:MAG: TIM-barrel domain-containing protein [Planctomycetota bacterium]